MAIAITQRLPVEAETILPEKAERFLRIVALRTQPGIYPKLIRFRYSSHSRTSVAVVHQPDNVISLDGRRQRPPKSFGLKPLQFVSRERRPRILIEPQEFRIQGCASI